MATVKNTRARKGRTVHSPAFPVQPPAVPVDRALLVGLPLAETEDKAVYEFVPIEVRCNEDGITDWHEVKSATNRWIFRVRDKARYRNAMTDALKSILLKLP